MIDERDLRIKKKIINERRKTGALLILIGIGLPLILSFFQQEGELRFFSSTMIAERSLTPREIHAIQKAIKRHKDKMSETQRIVEEIKERYRKHLGEDYYKDKWIVHNYSGFLISFKYILALGLLLVFVGLGKLIIG